MSIPKNKNIRKITVDGVQYYWSIKYDEDYGDIVCNIGLIEQSNFRFSFCRGADASHKKYFDNGVEEKDQVKAITSKLVAEAIQFANKNIDWKNKDWNHIFSNAEGFSLNPNYWKWRNWNKQK